MKPVLVALAMLAFVGTAIAADKPNFSGVWKMNTSKSDYGQIPAPESFVRKIEHAEPSISILEEQTGPGTTPSFTRKMTTDGHAADVQINGAAVKLTAAWDGSTLLATTSLEAYGLSFKDKMSLSDDGKVLTSVVQIESGQGNAEIKVVFERQ